MRAILTSIAFAGLACLGTAAAEGPLESQLVAYAISMNEDGKEVRQEAKDVEPGQIIEYTLVYSNVSDSELNGLVVSAPIPTATIFQIGSEKTAIASTFEVTDGEIWGVPPLMRETEEGMVAVPASEYTSVRWTPAREMDGGLTWEFNYRVAVE